MKHQDLRKPEKISVTLHPDVLKTLDLLCECFGDGTLSAERDYVIAGAIQDAALDRKFQEWLKTKTGSSAESVTEISTARKPKAKANQGDNDALSTKAVSA